MSGCEVWGHEASPRALSGPGDVVGAAGRAAPVDVCIHSCVVLGDHALRVSAAYATEIKI